MLNTVLAIVAMILFIVLALGVAGEFPLLAIGLAFLAASHVPWSTLVR